MGNKEKEIFEDMPVLKALLNFAIPTIIGQLVTMIYSLADTYFIGKTNNAYQLSAVSVTYVLLLLMNSLASLFGIGGGSLISRLLGQHKPDEARKVCAVSFYGAILVGLIYSLLCLCFMDPMLRAIGAGDSTIGYASSYTFWVVVIGGIPIVLNMTMSQLIRNEGYAKKASFGLGMSGFLNIILDPIFMFVILKPGHEVTGAAIATMISNIVTCCYFIITILKLRKTTSLSLSPKYIAPGMHYIGEIFSVGFPSAIGTLLICCTNIVTNVLASAHGDIALAAMGVVKKINMLPINIGMGFCQGMMPLVAYNYSSKNYKRMKSFINCSRIIGMGFAAICIVLFELWAEGIVGLFTKESATVEVGARLLRIVIIATPLIVSNFQMRYTLQAMGKGTQSLILSICRQGLFSIPLLFIMNKLIGLDGLMWAQIIANILTIIISFILYNHVCSKLKDNTSAVKA